MADLTDFVKKSLGLEWIEDLGGVGGGCISDSRSYQTQNGKLFVKTHEQEKGKMMFEGEYESLKRLNETNTVTVPSPITVLHYQSKKQYVLITEYLEMRSLSKYQTKLGEDLARLHLHNRKSLKAKIESGNRIGKADCTNAMEEFGFQVSTCCGSLHQDNSWNNSWLEFFARQKIQLQIDWIQKEYQDRELQTSWSELQQKLPKLFKSITVEPSLLHGDLWSGNAAETSSGPVVFDPASFYGHDEYDLAIAGMFGGFNKQFYNEYHNLIPKADGFEDRHSLYMIFHYLNHWNHFGSGYRSQAMSLMKELNKAV